MEKVILFAKTKKALQSLRTFSEWDLGDWDGKTFRVKDQAGDWLHLEADTPLFANPCSGWVSINDEHFEVFKV